MKKYFLTLVLGMFAVAGFSQITWDVHAGMTMNNFTQLDNADMKVSYNVGIGLDYAITDMWSFKSGLNFTGKGSKASVEDPYEKAEEKYCPTYLEIPLMAALKFNITDDMKFVVNAGPYLAIGLGGKDKYKYTDKETNTSVSTDYKLFKKEDGAEDAIMKRFDVGLQYGIGLEVGDHWLVNLTGQNGFINVFDGIEFYDETDKLSPKNMTFTIGVGYRF